MSYIDLVTKPNLLFVGFGSLGLMTSVLVYLLSRISFTFFSTGGNNNFIIRNCYMHRIMKMII